MSGRLSAALICAAALAAAGCATLPRTAAGLRRPDDTQDPWEGFNRRIFAFNQFLDRILIKPVAEGYVAVFTPPERDALRHVLNNLNEPVILANCVLQGRLKDAGVTGRRLIVNTTLGVAGIRDVATTLHLPRQIGDFGQTLWLWGFKPGPFLILPVLGPSSPRDGIGTGVDVYLDPLRYAITNDHTADALSISRRAADGIDTRARNLRNLDEIKRQAIDYYASFRSLYLQNRNADLTAFQPKVAPQAPPANFYNDTDQ